MKLSINAKILIAILALSIIPLLLLGVIAYNGITGFGDVIGKDTGNLKSESASAMQQINSIAVRDSTDSLQALGKEAIETRSQDAAKNLATFLYARDDDARLARTLSRTQAAYDAFLESKQGTIIYGDEKLDLPLYKEIAFYSTDGNLVLKRTIEGYGGKDYALDDFKSQIASLTGDKIYVSLLWGEYDFKSQAYAGVEKPDGTPYQGYYRWVIPVYDSGSKVGYLSLKLDAEQVIERIVHLSPTEKRYVALPDAPSGNYAYFVGADGWLNAHPREYHIKGVLPTGELSPPLDKCPNATPLVDDTTPLQFGHLSCFSKELDGIHTLHAVNGESGSQIYPWAGLTKWIAYSTVPYYTGSNYQTKMGFGWLAIGAEISKFSEPANLTAQKINTIVSTQEGQFSESVDRIQSEVSNETFRLRNLTLLVLIIAVLVATIVGLMISTSISRPIKQLTSVAKKVNDGDFGVKMPRIKSHDEVGELAASMEMLVAGLRNRQNSGKKK